MNEKLKLLPETREKFDKDIHSINSWLNDIEQNKRQLNNNDLTVTEYKRLIDKLKVDNLKLFEPLTKFLRQIRSHSKIWRRNA